MNNSSKRTISRILAFVMIVTCMFTNLIVANAEVSDITSDVAASGAAVEVSEDAATASSDYLFVASANIAAGEPVHSDDNADIVADQALNYTALTGLDTVGTNTYAGYIASSNVNTSMTVDGATANYRKAFTITAKNDVTVYIDCKVNNGKIAGIVTGNDTDGYTFVDVLDATSLTDASYVTLSTDIAAGNSATFIGKGTNVPVYGINVVAASTAEETTEETTVEETTSEETTADASGSDTSDDTTPIANVSTKFWLDDVAEDVDDGTGTITATVEPGYYAYDNGSTVQLLPGLKDEKYTQSYAAAIGVERDGKVVNGYKAGNRPTECNGFTQLPEAGSAAIFRPTETGTLTVYFVSTSFLRITDCVDGVPQTYTDSEIAAESYSIKVEAGHQYICSTTGKTNNMAYAGFEYIVDEPAEVSVTLNNVDANESSLAALEVYITDNNLNVLEATATVSGANSFTLYNGHTYKLSTNDGGVEATVNGSETFTVDSTSMAVTVDLYDIPDVTLTGTITGTPVGTVETLTFTNMINGTAYDAVITEDTYSVVLKPGEYNTSVVTNNDGVTYDRVSVAASAENVNEVYVEVPETGNSAEYVLPTEVANAETALTLNGITANNDTSVKGVAGSTIVIPVIGTQKVTVAGWFSGTWDINGQDSVTADGSSSASSPVTNSYVTDGTETSVTVNITGDGANYLYWIKVEDCVTFKSEISVPGDYDTLNDAMDAIGAMTDRPDGEEGRITINLTADLFEQVVIDAPYITLKGNDHEITWYYGIGTFYYSIGSDGLYSERLFRDKYSSNEANSSLWGGVVIVRGDNFLAEDTTFRNTYNFEVTDKELEDIAYSVASIPDRTTADVTQYASKERSNAFYIEADNIECYNCKILSSQDTLGRNGTANNNYHTYFKDCVISGNVDYICGEFTAVFDNCELQWLPYTNDGSNNNAKIGYIVAPKTSPYVFRNCYVTQAFETPNNVSGLYGRTWGSDSQAYFVNCETNGLVKLDGWGEMSSGDFATANFNEYNNVSKGLAFATEGDYAGTQLTDETLINNLTTDEIITAYLASWTPVHYELSNTEWTTEATTEATTEGTTVDPSGKADLTLGLVQGNNDDVLRGLYAGENMPAATELVGDQELVYVAGSNNPNIDGTSISGSQITAESVAIPNGGAYISFNAKVDGTFTVLAKINDGKTLYFAYEDGTRALDDYANSSGASVYESFDIPMTAGQTVYVYCQGSKARFFNIEFVSTASLAETTTEEDTEATTDETETTTDETDTTTETTTEAVTGSSDYLYVASANIAAGETVYSDDNADIVADQALAYKASTTVDTVGTNTYVGWVASSNVNTSMTVDGATANYRKAFTITAKNDVTVYVDCKVNDGKIAGIVTGNDTDGYTFADVLDATNLTEVSYTTLSVTLKAGESATFIGKGTNVPVYGINVVAASDVPDVDLMGDVDDSKAVTGLDAALTVQYILNPALVPDFITARADVSGNGTIDSEDAAMILQKALDSSYKFPVDTDEEDTTETTTEGDAESTTEATAVKVYVVGDSTACHYINTADDPAYVEGTALNDTYFWYKRVGFGDKIGNYLNENAEVVNLALSGRSSKSYATGINESGITDEAAVENYARLKSEIAPGDYLIIAWGHNDEKSDVYRHTDPTGDINTEGSFKNSLYENYIKVAQDAGATPILCTPIVRADASSLGSADKIHITSDGDYGQAIRDLGAELGVTVIDNLANTQALYDELQSEITPSALGVRKASAPSATYTINDDGTFTIDSTTDPTGYYKMHAADQGFGVDTTHLNNFGATMVAYMFAQSLKDSGNTLANYVVDAEAPTFDHADSFNTDWKPFDESEFIPSTVWKLSSPWYGSVFGDQGNKTITEDSHPYHDIIESPDGSVELIATNNNGKIASSSDGLVMYFQEIDANQNFTLTATAHINSYDASNNQSGFGLMLRDNMFSDYYYKTNASYFAVGNTTQTSGTKLVQAFRRFTAANGTKNLVMSVAGEAAASADENVNAFPEGTEIPLMISRQDGVVTVQYGDQEPYTFTCDEVDSSTGELYGPTDLTAISAEKDYVGAFVSRDADITFTNINYNNQ